ncbi:MAG TPA: BatD family protein [bacterium]|nr:BatD family protein [bacterium]HQO33926.1 BatD family protein [bacterium]HQP99493.1 BatD family protein [bacterium]
MREHAWHVCWLIWLSFLFGISAGKATGALSVNVSLEKTTAHVGEQVGMSIEITSDKGNPPVPQVPPVEGLSFHLLGGGGIQQSFQIVNGRMSAEYRRTVNFVVVAQREGTFTIGGVRVEDGGENATGNAVSLTVVAAGAPLPNPMANQPPGGPTQAVSSGTLQLMAQPSKTRAYVGEAVVIRYFLVGPQQKIGEVNGIGDFGNLTTGLFKRCVVEELPIKEYAIQSQTMGGRPMGVVLLKHFVAFPLSAGTLNMDPATIAITVGGIRSRFFPLGPSQTVNVTSQPFNLEVIPFPEEGRPDIFDGAVGEFNLTATVNKRELREGDAFTLRVELSGKGNIKNCPPPTLPDLSQFEQYDNTKEENISVVEDGVAGRIAYEYVLVPKSASSTEIGPIRFSFLNPKDTQYHTLATEPIHLQVSARGEGESDRILLGAGAGAKREIILTGEDFRHIAVGVPGAEDVRLDLYRQPLFVLVVLLPFGMLGGAMMWAWHRRRLETDPDYARNRKAPRMARRMLSEARKAVSSGDGDKTYAALTKVLVDYVGNRWNLPATGMTARDLGRQMQQKGVPDECVQDLMITLEDFEACRFGGAMNSNLRSDLQRTEDLLGKLMAIKGETA